MFIDTVGRSMSAFNQTVSGIVRKSEALSSDASGLRPLAWSVGPEVPRSSRKTLRVLRTNPPHSDNDFRRRLIGAVRSKRKGTSESANEHPKPTGNAGNGRFEDRSNGPLARPVVAHPRWVQSPRRSVPSTNRKHPNPANPVGRPSSWESPRFSGERRPTIIPPKEHRSNVRIVETADVVGSRFQHTKSVLMSVVTGIRRRLIAVSCTSSPGNAAYSSVLCARDNGDVAHVAGLDRGFDLFDRFHGALPALTHHTE